MVKRITTIAAITSIFLTSCANPTVVEYGHMGPMACNNITSELAQAKQALADSHKEDKFKLQYILIVPAAISAYRMNKAQNAAERRVTELEAAYRRQACSPEKSMIPQQPSLYNQPYGMDQRMNQQPQQLAPVAPLAPVYSAPSFQPQQNPPMPWQSNQIVPSPYTTNNGQFNQQLLQPQGQVNRQPIPLWQQTQPTPGY